MIYIIVLLIGAISSVLIINLVNYSTHKDMSMVYNSYRTRPLKVSYESNSFSHFKKNFFKVEWERDIKNKYSFFQHNDKLSLEYDNYIHASIVIVNNVNYKFKMISYIKYSIFLYLNRTTNSK